MKDAVVVLARVCEELTASGLSDSAVEAILQCVLVSPLPKRPAKPGDPKVCVALVWNPDECARVERYAALHEATVAHSTDDWRLAVGLMRQTGAGYIVSSRLESWPGKATDAALLERVARAHGGRWIFADGMHNGESPEAALARGMVLAVREFQRAGGAQ